MTWNHRVIKKQDNLANVYYEIHEVYYDNKGNPDGWTENPVTPYGNNLEDLHGELAYLLTALDKPVMEIVDGKLREIK